MIYFFSGTGNSRIVAQALGRLLNCEVTDMCDVQEIPDLGSFKSLGLVFPVYAWGLPKIVEKFVGRMCCAEGASPFLWAVMTCGDDMGYADEILNDFLHKAAGLKIVSVYSVPMPNTYVCLPGFDVDASDEAAKKVECTRKVMPEIANKIRLQMREVSVERGSFPWLKTYVLRPLFNRFLLTDRYFKAQSQQCTRCGLCARSCPTGNIQLSGEGVQWGSSQCIGCLRCYHSCPQRAIDWGRVTKSKGQKLRVEEF